MAIFMDAEHRGREIRRLGKKLKAPEIPGAFSFHQTLKDYFPHLICAVPVVD